MLDPEDTGIDFSIAHSAGVVAVALSDVYRVGVDVEPAVPQGADPIVWSELSASERARLATAPEAERARWFLRMWTLKEAFVKSTGAGASMRFDRLDTSFDPPRVVVDGRDFDADVWSWCHRRSGPSNRSRTGSPSPPGRAASSTSSSPAWNQSSRASPWGDAAGRAGHPATRH